MIPMHGNYGKTGEAAGGYKHGDANWKNKKRSPEYSSMANMLNRCKNPKHPSYPKYGGLGIRVTEEWNHLSKYPAFLAHMGRKPTPNHTIERIDTKGNYEPGNVKWATRAEQNRNKSDTVLLTFGGVTLCRNEMARKHGLTPDQLRKRLRLGWSLEIALTKPISIR